MRGEKAAVPVALRQAAPEDIPKLMAIEAEAAQAFRTLPGYAFVADLPVRDRKTHERTRASGVRLVTEAEHDLVGFLMAIPVDGRAHVLELAVASPFQGRGIGSTLLAAFERWGRETGFTDATLTTFRDVPWNAPAYGRLGYTPFDPCPEDIELNEIIAEEKAAGFWEAPRVAMRKVLE